MPPPEAEIELANLLHFTVHDLKQELVDEEYENTRTTTTTTDPLTNDVSGFFNYLIELQYIYVWFFLQSLATTLVNVDPLLDGETLYMSDKNTNDSDDGDDYDEPWRPIGSIGMASTSAGAKTESTNELLKRKLNMVGEKGNGLSEMEKINLENIRNEYENAKEELQQKKARRGLVLKREQLALEREQLALEREKMEIVHVKELHGIRMEILKMELASKINGSHLPKI